MVEKILPGAGLELGSARSVGQGTFEVISRVVGRAIPLAADQPYF